MKNRRIKNRRFTFILLICQNTFKHSTKIIFNTRFCTTCSHELLNLNNVQIILIGGRGQNIRRVVRPPQIPHAKMLLHIVTRGTQKWLNTTMLFSSLQCIAILRVDTWQWSVNIPWTGQVAFLINRKSFYIIQLQTLEATIFPCWEYKMTITLLNWKPWERWTTIPIDPGLPTKTEYVKQSSI